MWQKANAEIGIEWYNLIGLLIPVQLHIMLQSIKTKDIAVRRLGLVISFKNGNNHLQFSSKSAAC